MSKRKFEIAVEDHEAAKLAQEYHLEVFEIAGEDYAAVRPATKAFSALLKDSFGARSDPAVAIGIAFNFLNVCFDKEDLVDALSEHDEYVQDEALTEAAEKLADSNARLTARLMDRHDDLGEMTLVNVMIDLVEGWSGKDTGSRPVSSPRSSTTGRRSTATASSKASTRSKSTTARRAGSSTRHTAG